jgi:hypothetical protein
VGLTGIAFSGWPMLVSALLLRGLVPSLATVRLPGSSHFRHRLYKKEDCQRNPFLSTLSGGRKSRESIPLPSMVTGRSSALPRFTGGGASTSCDARAISGFSFEAILPAPPRPVVYTCALIVGVTRSLGSGGETAVAGAMLPGCKRVG